MAKQCKRCGIALLEDQETLCEFCELKQELEELRKRNQDEELGQANLDYMIEKELEKVGFECPIELVDAYIELKKELEIHKELIKFVKYLANECRGTACKFYSQTIKCEGCLCFDAKQALEKLTQKGE